MRQFKRSERIRSQMLRDIQSLLEHETAAKLESLVTFTDVEITSDLKFAKIFYSVLGDDKAKEKTSNYLGKIRGRVQAQLGRMLRIKYTPEITFEFDPSIERGMIIEKLLNDISRDNDSEDKKNS